MLTSLHIANFVLVREAELEFGPGLTVVTGETGAGKSVLVSAVELILGDRGGDEWIRTGQEEALIEAVFDARAIPRVHELLARMDLPDAEPLVIRRKIIRGGRGRCQVGGAAVSVAQLREIGECLINIHGQNEHQTLLSPRSQADLLDAFADLSGPVAEYAARYGRYAALRDERTALQQEEGQREERRQYLAFQIGELEKARLEDENELETLQASRNRLDHAAQLAENLDGARAVIETEESGLRARLSQLVRRLDEAARIDPDLAPLAADAARLFDQVRELAADIERVGSRPEADAERYQEIDDRLDLLRRLLRKHGGSVAEARKQLEIYRAEAARLDGMDERLRTAETRVREAGDDLRARAQAVARGREAAGKKLARGIERELKDLLIEHPRFSIDVTPMQEIEASPGRVQYQVSLNAGEPLRPLQRTASGGEMSRIMLAVENVTARCGGIPTLIFDEVDVNIGGRAASAVGRKLEEIAAVRQVICITHQASVARLAKTHVLVDKQSRSAGETVTRIRALSAPDRQNEIARMLAGQEITDATLRHAREMLEN